jgi:hypothetical protein
MPLVHDVSTDPDSPPQFVQLREAREHCANGYAYSGLAGAAHRKRYPHLHTVQLEQPPLEVFYAAYELVRAREWFLVNARKWRHAGDEQIEGRLEATASTRVLRFRDDVVIRLLACDDQYQHTRLDMRSASRVGMSDFGVNARRVRDFLFDLKKSIKSNS